MYGKLSLPFCFAFVCLAGCATGAGDPNVDPPAEDARPASKRDAAPTGLPPVTGGGGTGGAGGTGGSMVEGSGGGGGTGGASTRPDAGALDAGRTVDAGTLAPDAAAGAGGDAHPTTPTATVACRSDYLLCEDFEGTVNPALVPVVAGAKLVADESRAVSGKRSAHATINSGGTNAYYRVAAPALPVSGNNFFGRMYLFSLPRIPTLHIRLLTAKGSGGGEYRMDSNEGGKISSRYDGPGVDAHGGLRKNGPTLAGNRWYCVEWQYDGSKHEMRYWVDGEPQPSMTVTSAEGWKAPRFESLEIGVHPYKGSPAWEIWYDAIALSTERIGCLAAAGP